MGDLISRAAAICCLGNSPEQMCMPWSEVERMLRELPAVNAAPVVHGRWIRQKGSAHVFKCSACGFMFAGAAIAKYCPNCGAKMDGERRDSE